MGISAENAELSQRGVQQAQQPAGSNDLPFSVVSRSWTSATWKVKVKVCMYVGMLKRLGPIPTQRVPFPRSAAWTFVHATLSRLSVHEQILVIVG